MNLNVYEKYKVKCKGQYSYNTPTFDCDNDWHTEKVKWQKTLDGGRIMEMIATSLKDSYCEEINIDNNKILISYFNYNNGECRSYTYTIEQIPTKKAKESLK